MKKQGEEDEEEEEEGCVADFRAHLWSVLTFAAPALTGANRVSIPPAAPPVSRVFAVK